MTSSSHSFKAALRACLLAPPAGLYGLGTGLRSMAYDSGLIASHSPRVKTVCVGNLAVGGTGKTPHTAYLISMLKENRKIAVLSRGYGRATSGFVLADGSSTFRQLGDEAMQQHLSFPDVPVAVCEDRMEGIERLTALVPGLELVLLDDAMQHRSIRPGLSVLLTEYGRLYTDDHLMPWGRLREGRKAARRAQVVVVSKCPGPISSQEREQTARRLSLGPDQMLCFSVMRYAPIRPVGPAAAADLEQLGREERPVVVLTGIARPDAMTDYLKDKVSIAAHLRYADHHAYTPADLTRIERVLRAAGPGAVIITTQKDAARLRDATLSPAVESVLYELPVSIDFMSDTEKFNTKIQSYVAENQ